MEFALSEDQRLLQDSMHKFLQRAAPLATVRALADATPPTSGAYTPPSAEDKAERARLQTELWQGFVEMGGAGILIAEAHGGLGLELLDAALVAECLGYAAAPLPFLAQALAVPLALQLGGSAAQQREFLPRLASGALRVGAAFGSPHDQLSFTKGRLSGAALFCLDGTDAELYLAAAGDTFYLVPASELTATPMPGIDGTRQLVELVCDKAAAEPLGGRAAPKALAQTLRAARIACAADSLGAARAMLEKARDYALERKQFNRLIGSFQAVKHMCAEMAAQLEPCHALVWYAAHACDKQLDDAATLALYAKAQLGEVGQFIARTATEVHGGMGFTDLLGLHYWFKRLGFNRQILGAPTQLRETAARLQGWC